MTTQARGSASAGEAGIDRFLRWGLVGTLLVVVSILVYGTVMVHRERPPIPDQVVGPGGAVLYTKDKIIDGKGVFQRTDLMDFGSLYGNGAYFGPDWGTDYLHREGQLMRDYNATQRFGSPYDSLATADRAAIDQQVIDELKTNRYSKGVLTLTERQVAAHKELQTYYRNLFIDGDKKLGLPADTVRNTDEADELGAFFGWVAWTSAANRPGEGFFQWLRAPGDLAFGLGGTSVLIDLVAKLRFRRLATVGEEVELPPLPAEEPLLA